MSFRGYLGGLVFLGLVVSGEAVDAQTRAPRPDWTMAKSLSCVFPIVTTGAWNKGEAAAEVKPASLSIRFTSIDIDEGTARAIGSFGPSDIIVKLSERTLHFLQMFRAGPLYTTTVFDSESRSGKLKAVHTRHEYTDVSLPGFTSKPEQYYGECSVEP
jgi:hypothetical protein